MAIKYIKFSEININDKFFDSLKEDYREFPQWFEKKKDHNAYVFFDDTGNICGFLYLKIETSVIDDVDPPLPPMQRIKLGTFKINAHGTRLGECFVKKALDYAIINGIKELYVTVFEKHLGLIKLLARYGFKEAGIKRTLNGTEKVLLKKLDQYDGDIFSSYPLIETSKNKYLLSILPKWHSRLFPDSILKNEDPSQIIYDVSHTNSINKIYLCKMNNVENLRNGDLLVMYRTTDGEGPAYYRSVATTICVVDKVDSIYRYKTVHDFINEVFSYSVFDKEELVRLYNTKEYSKIIHFTYNVSFVKRVVRQYMLENIGIPNEYWGFYKLSDQHFFDLIQAGKVNERYIINKT